MIVQDGKILHFCKMKYFYILIFIVCSCYHSSGQTNHSSRLSLSLDADFQNFSLPFSKTPFSTNNLGLSISGHYNWLKKDQFRQLLKIGFYSNANQGNGIYAFTAPSYYFSIQKNKFEAGLFAGIGVIDFLGKDEWIIKNNVWQKINTNNYRLSIPLGIDLNYKIFSVRNSHVYANFGFNANLVMKYDSYTSIIPITQTSIGLTVKQ